MQTKMLKKSTKTLKHKIVLHLVLLLLFFSLSSCILNAHFCSANKSVSRALLDIFLVSLWMSIFALHWKLNVLVHWRFMCVHFIRSLSSNLFLHSLEVVPFCHCHYLTESSANKRLQRRTHFCVVCCYRQLDEYISIRTESYLTLNFMRHWIIENWHMYISIAARHRHRRTTHGESKHSVARVKFRRCNLY